MNTRINKIEKNTNRALVLQFNIQTSHPERDLFGTYEGLDALQDKVAGDVAGEVLAQLGDQFGIALILLPQQVKLLLLVTVKRVKK